MTSGVEGSSMKSTESEEQRLRERLKRRQEERRASNSQQRKEDPEEKKDELSFDNRGHDRDHRSRGRQGRLHPRGPHPPHQMHPRGAPYGHVDGSRGGWNGPPRGHFRGPPPRGPPPPAYYRGGPPPPRHRRSPSRSLSSSRSRSYSRSRSRSPYSSDSSRSSDSRSFSSSSDEDESDLEQDETANALTKDQRTVFVTQLVMRADERDVSKYFRKVLGCRVNEVVLLKDRRSGKHKGCAYVELGRVDDVAKAVAASNTPPDFQRFPILIKASEAEKNYVMNQSQSTVTAKQMLGVVAAPIVSPETGKITEAQKVYLGNLDPSVSETMLYSIFSNFGLLQKVAVQLDPTTGTSRGFAFLSFCDAKDANLAIHTMSGQIIAGRPLKTGWANQTATITGVDVVTSTEFPSDAASRIQNAHLALSQVTGKTTGATFSVPRVAPLVPAAVAPLVVKAKVEDAKIVKNADDPTSMVLVHNMFDKDQETEPGWQEDIRLDFEEECSKWGKIISVVVMHKEVGGKIYASFENTQQAQTCASNLAGRWFDKRQLRVEFVKEMPSLSK